MSKKMNARYGKGKHYKAGSNQNSKRFDEQTGGGKRRNDAKAGAFNAEMDKAQSTLKHLGEVENDSTFYYSSEEYIKPFANIPFNNINGLATKGWPNLTLKYQDAVSMYGVETDHMVPGIMTVDFMPTVGFSDSALSPLNVAALKNYAFIRHENSGSTNYDATNLMMYNMAVLGLIPAILHVRRALLSIGLYSETNRYAPDTLIRAMGYEPTTLRNNLANYIGRYNLLTTRFNKFAIPAGFKHVLRWEFLCNNIFTDKNLNKAQLYLFRPICMPVYHEIGTGSKLPEIHYEAIVNSDNTPKDLSLVMSAIENALDKLYLSDAIGTMSGDVLKAYGLENLYKLDPITDADTVRPTYSETALWQIHNCTTVPYVSFANSDSSMLDYDVAYSSLMGTKMKEIVDAEQATSYLTQPYILANLSAEPTKAIFGAFTSRYLASASLMDVDRDSPNFQDVLEITRTKSLSTKTEGASCYIDVVGTEVYICFHLWDMNNKGSLPASTFGSYWSRYNPSPEYEAQMNQAMSRLSAFDWAPSIVSVLNVGDQVQAERLFSELDNSVYVSAEDVLALNNAVMQHVFGVLD